MERKTLKLMAGGGLVFGLILEFFELLFAPSALLLESSYQYPSLLRWVRFALIAGAAIFAVDWGMYKKETG